MSNGVFWLLLVLGLAVLGACLLVPEWLEYQQLKRQRAQLGGRLRQTRADLELDRQTIQAAQHDVAFNERLLIEELNYARPGEQDLLPGRVERTPTERATLLADSTAAGWLQAFAERDSRNILLVMSAGLLLFVFIYYPPKSRTSQTRPAGRIPVRPAPASFIEPTSSRQSNSYST